MTKGDIANLGIETINYAIVPKKDKKIGLLNILMLRKAFLGPLTVTNKRIIQILESSLLFPHISA